MCFISPSSLAPSPHSPKLSTLLPSLLPAQPPLVLPPSHPAGLGSHINYQTLYPSQLSIQRHTGDEETLALSPYMLTWRSQDPVPIPGLKVVAEDWGRGNGQGRV